MRRYHHVQTVVAELRTALGGSQELMAFCFSQLRQRLPGSGNTCLLRMEMYRDAQAGELSEGQAALGLVCGLASQPGFSAVRGWALSGDTALG